MALGMGETKDDVIRRQYGLQPGEDISWMTLGDTMNLAGDLGEKIKKRRIEQQLMKQKEQDIADLGTYGEQLKKRAEEDIAAEKEYQKALDEKRDIATQIFTGVGGVGRGAETGTLAGIKRGITEGLASRGLQDTAIADVKGAEIGAEFGQRQAEQARAEKAQGIQREQQKRNKLLTDQFQLQQLRSQMANAKTTDQIMALSQQIQRKQQEMNDVLGGLANLGGAIAAPFTGGLSKGITEGLAGKASKWFA